VIASEENALSATPLPLLVSDHSVIASALALARAHGPTLPATLSPDVGLPDLGDRVSTEERTDEQLMAALAGGERDALSELYARYAPLMLGVGIKMIRNREEAEDIVHDVFMEAWRRAQQYDRTRGTVRAWLVLRMRSRVVDRIRSAPRRREVATEHLPEAPAPGHTSSAPEPKLASEQRLLRDAVLSLPQELQDAIDCVYFRAMSVQEAADKLGWPTGTVKSRLFAARKRLREALPEGGPAVSTPLADADRELAWAYALDALDDAEHQAAEARLASDEAFAAEVEAARADAALLAFSADPVTPSAAARERLAAELAYDGPFASLVSSLARLADLGRETMQTLVQGIAEAAGWEDGPGEGIRIFHLDGGPATAGAVVGFVKIPAGGFFPEHTHGGRETVIVMQGRLIDSLDGSRAGPGDVVVREAGSTHTTSAGDEEDCIYLVVVFEGVTVGDQFIGPGDPQL
jgi:RNA polymerase sigma-70 factor (ECF subfamily)